MKTFRYTEAFISQQGEARYTGVPSVFVRLFGCNLRCPSFNSVTPSTTNYEVQEIIQNIDKYKTFDELPLVQTGCDSYPSVYPEFRHLAKEATSDELVDELIGLLPTGQWNSNHNDVHLVITGGEPLLKGWQKSYSELLFHDKMASLREITFETNGTQDICSEFAECLTEWRNLDESREVTFSVSTKLSCSGESKEKTLRPETVVSYQKYGYAYLKLVVATEEDVAEALEVIDLYRKAGFTGPVYLMPIGGTSEAFQLNNRQVADMALKHGLRYSDRLHIGLYGNQWAT